MRWVLIIPPDPEKVLGPIIRYASIVGRNVPIVILQDQGQVPGQLVGREQAAVNSIQSFRACDGIVKRESVFEIVDTIVCAGLQPEFLAELPVELDVVRISYVVVVTKVLVLSLGP